MPFKTTKVGIRPTKTVLRALAGIFVMGRRISRENKNDKKETAEQETWSNGLEFLMSCISMSVGLGNIWRFPFTVYENGGGAFLIPYLICLFLIGQPLYYLEMALGQFSSKASVRVWNICPAFLGIGYGQAIAASSIATYYASLLAVNLYYLVVSCQSVLPWTKCRPEWGNNCVDSYSTGSFHNVLNSSIKLQSSSELYFLKDVIHEKDDISDGLGLPEWKLTLALLASWAVIFLVIMKGVKSSGKSAYFLALFPYVILIALLVRAVTLEGSLKGIMFFLEPNWYEVFNPKVWKEAVVQCCFSLAVGIGPLIMYASYNRFNHRFYKDVVVITCIDTLTSLMAGLSMFGILGNLAHNLQIDDIKEVVKGGTALAFISYPDAIAKFHAAPQLFAILFFVMLYVLGVGSLVAIVSSVVTVINDHFKSVPFWKVALITSICGFCTGLVYLTPGGQWILNLVDFYGGFFVIFALAILETTAISWIYGLNNFCDDLEFMTKREISLYWRVCWAFFTPVLMIVIMGYSFLTWESITFEGKLYPESANVAGWTLFATGLSQFPLWGIWYIVTHRNGGMCKTARTSIRANAKWGPMNEHDREEWINFKTQRVEQRSKRNKSSKIVQFLQKFQN